MSAPQPPEDRDPRNQPGPAPTSDAGAHPDSASRTYDFHGEKLDFDPYRFGAPEPSTPAWSPPAPAAGDAPRPPAPGERWHPGADTSPDVRPGDYWQGGGGPGSSGGPVFPPAGYSPPPGGDRPVDLDKSAPDGARDPGAPADRSAWAPPSGYPAPGGGHPAPGTGYPPPGGYPAAPQDARKSSGNGLAVAGLVVGIVGLVLALSSWPGIVVGLVGLGLAIGGLARSRRGAPLKGLAVAGIICSALAVVIGSVVLVLALSRVDFDCVRDANGNFEQAQECVR